MDRSNIKFRLIPIEEKRQVEKQQWKVKFVSYIIGFLAFTANDNVRDM